jgi:hypothetical protein
MVQKLQKNETTKQSSFKKEIFSRFTFNYSFQIIKQFQLSIL